MPAHDRHRPHVELIILVVTRIPLALELARHRLHATLFLAADPAVLNRRASRGVRTRLDLLVLAVLELGDILTDGGALVRRLRTKGLLAQLQAIVQPLVSLKVADSQDWTETIVRVRNRLAADLAERFRTWSGELLAAIHALARIIDLSDSGAVLLANLLAVVKTGEGLHAALLYAGLGAFGSMEMVDGIESQGLRRAAVQLRELPASHVAEHVRVVSGIVLAAAGAVAGVVEAGNGRTKVRTDVNGPGVETRRLLALLHTRGRHSDGGGDDSTSGTRQRHPLG
jgi:hypothetical protein